MPKRLSYWDKTNTSLNAMNLNIASHGRNDPKGNNLKEIQWYKKMISLEHNPRKNCSFSNILLWKDSISFQAKVRAAALKLEQQIILADCQVLAAILNFINQVSYIWASWSLVLRIFSI